MVCPGAAVDFSIVKPMYQDTIPLHESALRLQLRAPLSRSKVKFCTINRAMKRCPPLFSTRRVILDHFELET